MILFIGGALSQTNTTIASEVQKLAPSAIIELFEIDASVIVGVPTLYRFHSGKNQLIGDLVWQGNTYNAFPIEASGFEWNGKGQMPRPKVVVSNVLGTITALVLAYQDLIGCKFTRIRTLQKYLDVVNFITGNPDADPTAEFPRDVYYIDRKSNETKDLVEFELAASLDLAGVALPRRQVVQNYCPWKYRGAECGYTGTNYFDTNDAPVASLALDVCGKRLSSCRARFGQYGELPYGGFPAAGLMKT
jgi:lambda family phage minor tail protein L